MAATRKWIEDPPLDEVAGLTGFASAKQAHALPRGVRHMTVDSPLLTTDVTDVLLAAGWPDKSIEVQGSFSGSATVTVKGSNDPSSPASFFGLHDPSGAPLVFNGAGQGAAIAENVAAIRLEIGAGDGSTSITPRVTLTR